MALLETKVYSALSGNATIATKVGSRIYPVVMPQDPTLPAITYHRTSGNHMAALSGYTNLENAHILIQCWATRYDAVKELAEDVHVVMDGATAFKSMLADDADGFDSDTGLFSASQDYSVWNRTT